MPTKINPRQRLVLDTNALVSRLLVPSSVPARAVDRALVEGQPLASEATLEELAAVLARPKFDAYVSIEDRQEFLRLLGRLLEIVPIVHTIQACRDPRDDKFLELAINGEAELIVSGDEDLHSLNPFRGIAILRPRDYLKLPQ